MAVNTARDRALVLMGRSSEVYRAANPTGAASWRSGRLPAVRMRQSRSFRNNSPDFAVLTVDLWGLRNVKPISSTE